MKIEERLKNYPRHDSMRGEFGYYLYLAMAMDPNIILLVGDLGYKLFDCHKEDMESQFINVGASEQVMIGIASGLAMAGKIPVVYSITPFLVYRGFEGIRNYINREKINVKLIGSGIDKDYAHDGPSHWAEDIYYFMDGFNSISKYYPDDKTEIKDMVLEVLTNKNPCFVGLRR